VDSRTVVENLQAAFFLTTIDLSDKLLVVSTVKAETKNAFDGDPTMLPVPPDAAPEIPRVVLRNKAGNLNAIISAVRADVLNTATISGPDRHDAQQHFLGLVAQFSAALSKLNSLISRIAWVETLLIELPTDAIAILQSRWLRETPFPILRDVSVQYVTRASVGSVEANRVIRIATAHDKEDAARENLIRITVDINTIPEVNLRADSDLALTLVTSLSEDANAALQAVRVLEP
jgi:hypothetical protein